MSKQHDDLKRSYTNGEITVYWDGKTCVHSGKCIANYDEVFNPRAKPWVNLVDARGDQVIESVKKCPSGALSYAWNKDIEPEFPEPEYEADVNLKLGKNGPILLEGNFIMRDEKGHWIDCGKKAALCRCGESANKPFCDGSHKAAKFTS